MGYFDNLFGYDWELSKSPAGAYNGSQKNGHAISMTPDILRKRKYANDANNRFIT